MIHERIDDAELRALLADTESDRAERKEAATDSDKIGQAICAFANDMPGHDRPGVLFVNARDDGTWAGNVVDDRLLLTLAQAKTQGNVLPPPSMTVEKRTLDGRDFAVVTVMPSDAPPVRYKGVCWIRTGPSRARATTSDERILRERRRANDLPFDVQPVRGASLSDLKRSLFEDEYLPAAFAPEVIAENGRSYEEKLASLRLVERASDPVPTIVGLLVLCPRVRDFLPGAYVQFLRFDGVEPTDPVVDELLVDGPLGQLVRRLDEKLVSHVRTGVDFTSGRKERRSSDYPVVALEQLTRNALMHRTYEGTNMPVRVYWYADRIEIVSPGGPFGSVTRSNFGVPGITDYRNPAVAEAMRNLGLVQRFGLGIATARKALAENGNPELELHVEDSHVSVTLRRRP